MRSLRQFITAGVTPSAILLLWACTDKARDVVDDIKEMEPRHVKIANTNLPVVVEDGDYSEELINIAINEISLIYSRLKGYYIGNSTFTRNYLINGETVQTNTSINKGSQSLYEPSKLSKHFVDLIEVDGEHHVILSNSIMDEFKKAVQFYELYEKEISKLDTFRNRVNDFESLTDDESSRLSDAYYDFKDIRTNADIIKHCYIPRPSVLDFFAYPG